MPFDSWAARAPRRMLAVMAVGLVVIAVGLWRYHSLDETVRQRVAHGVAVDGQVRDVSRLSVGRSYATQRVTVAYPAGGQQHEAVLMSLITSGSYAKGDPVVLYVDPTDPAKVTTADGFASEGWQMEVPVPVVGLGGILVVCPLLVWLRDRWRRHR
jgi:hypothetical protein